MQVPVQAVVGQQDVSVVSEQLTHELAVLATEVQARLTSRSHPQQALLPPPWPALRQLHPLFFSHPHHCVSHAGSCLPEPLQQEQEQQHQLGVVLQVHVPQVCLVSATNQ